MTQVRIEFEKGGVFVARLLADAAPKTCKVIQRRLPFAYRFHHSIVSGQAIVTVLPDLTAENENQRVAGILPGSLCFLVRNEPVLVPDEIYITYGIFSSRGLSLDMKQPVNVFAQIDENVDALKQACTRVLMSGAETIRFSLAQSGR